MKEKILAPVFCIMWMLTGCSLDAMFESEESFWTVIIAFVVTVLVAFILWGNRDGRQTDL